MPDPSPERPPIPPDQATRDIRLPPLPGRPPPEVRSEWTSYVPAERTAPAEERPSRPEGEGPTDKLPAPSDPARNRTLSFQPPPSVQLFKVSVTPRRRRWTGRVLWILFFLIVAVLVACGVWLLLFFDVL